MSFRSEPDPYAILAAAELLRMQANFLEELLQEPTMRCIFDRMGYNDVRADVQTIRAIVENLEAGVTAYLTKGASGELE